MNLLALLCLGPQIALAGKSLAGFNYGAFWGKEENPKTKQDFLDGFNMAKNLNTDISFNNARLFSCKVNATSDEPSPAFEAAIETKTNLLLGFWITPSTRTESHDKLIDAEFSALEKGFQKHGQALADLVLGLSVGNEDIYRFVDTAESGVAADNVAQTIDKVKKRIAASSFANYMKAKPIGHIDTAQHAVVDNADFIGMNAYPYWTNEHIDKAKLSFLATLESVKQKAGNRPVWVTEVGWPFKGPQRGDAVASAENLQKYWTEVGCAIFGNYPTFWFELVTDSTPDQPDWGLMDIPSRQPRIKDLKCPTAFPSAIPSSAATSPPSGNPKSTIHVNTTNGVNITVTASPPAPKLTQRSSPSGIPADRPWCVTVADIDGNGQHVPVDAGPAGSDGKCKDPPAWTWPSGSPSAAPSAPSAKPPPAAPTSQAAGSSGVPAPAPLLASQATAIQSKPASALAPAPSAAPAQSSSSVHPYCKAKSKRRAASLAARASAALPTLSTRHEEACSTGSDYNKRLEKRKWNDFVNWFKRLKFW